MTWQKINLVIPENLTRRQRVELADLVIEHIVERTENGVDKDGKKFPKYSKSYLASLDFQNAGKSASHVDLTLSGDMLAAMALLSERKGNIMIGFENGTLENDKAEGNILGSYGRDPDPKKARDFLGLSKSKLAELIDHVTEGDDGG